MIRFRNLLVRDYVRSDPSRVHSFLQKRSGDFEIFMKHIIEFLRRQMIRSA
ncbi:TPA: DUF86 domain-containing protein [Candidatus Bathyarchaeota archaeon]|nr:DUF86 domain-containing protein [Candidatus Bathyarchaeota archaeon]